MKLDYSIQKHMVSQQLFELSSDHGWISGVVQHAFHSLDMKSRRVWDADSPVLSATTLLRSWQDVDLKISLDKKRFYSLKLMNEQIQQISCTVHDKQINEKL